MDFAEWVVSGLDRYRVGQLPEGQAFFQVVWNRLGTDPRLTAFLDSGDPTARRALVELVAQAARDAAFEQQLRAAAPGAGGGAAAGAGAPAGAAPTQVAAVPGWVAPAGQPAPTQSWSTAAGPRPGQQQPAWGAPGDPAPAAPGWGAAATPTAPGSGAGPTKPAFFKTTGGIVTLVVLAVGLAGGGVALAMAGGDGGSLGSKLQGTWHCGAGFGGDMTNADLTIGDGTWSLSGTTGTWKQNGGTVTLTSAKESTPLVVTGVPSDYGVLNVTVTDSTKEGSAHITGSTSASAIHLQVGMNAAGDPSGLGAITVNCTR